MEQKHAQAAPPTPSSVKASYGDWQVKPEDALKSVENVEQAHGHATPEAAKHGKQFSYADMLLKEKKDPKQ